MRLLSPARTCHMAAFQTRVAQPEANAPIAHLRALMGFNATPLPNTEQSVGSSG